jgi:hypothetical protein
MVLSMVGREWEEREKARLSLSYGKENDEAIKYIQERD